MEKIEELIWFYSICVHKTNDLNLPSFVPIMAASFLSSSADSASSTLVNLNYGLVATYDYDMGFIYIEGKTFENKDRLKALGAKWVPELKAWMCGADTDLSSLHAPAAAPEVVGGAAPAAPRKKITLKRSLPRQVLNFGLISIIGPDAVYIKGLVYENSGRLGSLGGRWDEFEKAYVFPAGFDLTPLRVPAGEVRIAIPVPEPKPWWFCGHKTARILSLDRMHHSCSECPQSDMYYNFYIRGSLHRGD